MSVKELEKELIEIDSLKKSLLEIVKTAVANPECVNTSELGEAVDIVKDFAEIKKECYQAEYYKTVTEAMSSPEYTGDPEEPVMGYNSRRYPSSGRYASQGSGESYGYRMRYPDMNYPDNIRMGYSDSGRSSSGNNSSSYNQNGGRSGYMFDVDYDPRYGRSYNEYRTARRHYHESNSTSDKDEMDSKASEHLSDMINSAKEIYKNSTPDMKKRMKEDMTRFMNDLQSM